MKATSISRLVSLIISLLVLVGVADCDNSVVDIREFMGCLLRNG